jgi:hypothetical protein
MPRILSDDTLVQSCGLVEGAAFVELQGLLK